MQSIESSQNRKFKNWLSLLESKGIQTHHRAILAGKKVIQDTLNVHSNYAIALLVPPKTKFHVKFDGETYKLSPKLFDQLDVFGTGYPLLEVQIPQIKKWSSEEKVNGCALYLTQQDPRNVGAMLRSAAAFGVSQIILGPGAAHPFHPQSVRAASGCVFDHQYFRASGFADFENFATVGLDMTGENLADFVFPKNFVLVPGVEGQGLDKKFEPSHRVNIRISTKAESLNVMQATTIALYEWSKTV